MSGESAYQRSGAAGAGRAHASITRDFTLEGARAFAALGTPERPLRFVFMTSMGITQTPGWFSPAYVRVKGETEAALRAAEGDGFAAVFVRPGGILPTEEVSHPGRAARPASAGTLAVAQCSADTSAAPSSSGTTASPSTPSRTSGPAG